ncbi:thioredoxin family protein [Flocculibacter collagenilyticus]|uniref:thioredoxin family protein n=1 Tax=Flocculibacter collagenilyticus TaxID=2744479 RepID=UPI0018F32582|nr:thioredoxin family protein [Flocculibacter collagenilyticus]
MNVRLFVTKTDFCVPNLEKEFQQVGINYHVEYIEDNPELALQHHIRHSPNIFIDDELAFRAQPTVSELKQYFNIK